MKKYPPYPFKHVWNDECCVWTPVVATGSIKRNEDTAAVCLHCDHTHRERGITNTGSTVNDCHWCGCSSGNWKRHNNRALRPRDGEVFVAPIPPKDPRVGFFPFKLDVKI
jgi:hypothetical protein